VALVVVGLPQLGARMLGWGGFSAVAARYQRANGRCRNERGRVPCERSLGAIRMHLGILGPLEVLDDGRRVALGGDRQRALLALLLIHANEAVSAERLIDELWGERPPQTAAKTLQVHISRLRKALPQPAGPGGDGTVVTREHGYELSVDRERVDSLVFERLVAEARGELAAKRFGRARSLLEEALSLWRGPPLAEFAYERFAELEIARLEELRISAREELLEAKLALGHHAEVVGELELLISEHPYRGRLRAQLMLALYRSDRQAEALQTYQDSRRTLVEELGIEPSERLRELERAILAQDPKLAFVEQEWSVPEPAEVSQLAFVGRERELGELATCLEDACLGHGRLVLLSGEPGIGKSRLADELIARARAGGARVLVGRAWEAGGAPAYWPWMQALRGYVREREAGALRSELADGAAELAQIIPEVRQRLPEIGEPPVLEPELARFRLFDAATEFLRNASRSRPMVLALDDLHAADAPSLLLLRFLARELSPMRVLIVVAYRDIDPIPGEPLAEMISEVVREPTTRRLALTGLSEREVEQYMELTAAEIASAELATTLFAETEGNPLFVGEIVRLRSLEGVPSRSADGAALVIPKTVREVIARRLAHLSPECQRLLALASVIGREFALKALAGAADSSEDELLELLDETVSERVVVEVPDEGGRLRFAHILIRDTLYEDLGATRRVRLHRRVLGALEALYGEDAGPHLAELANHAIAARDLDNGVGYAWRAADRSLELLAYEEAARLYQTALDGLVGADRGREEDRCELLLSLAEARARAGDTPAAKAAFIDAAGLAGRFRLPRALARAAAGYGGRLAWARAGDDEQMVPLLEEGLAALGDGDIQLRARLLARLAGALRDDPSRERRDAVSREAVELARRSNDPSTLAYVLDGRAAAIVAHDTAADVLALGAELSDVARQAGDPEKAVAGQIWRYHAQLLQGEIGGAERALAAADRSADELRQPVQLWLVCAERASLLLATGRFGDAKQLMEKAIALGEHAQPHGAIPIYWFQRFTLADFVGGLEEVEPPLREVATRYPARVMFRCALTYLDARLGRLEQSTQALEALAADDFSALPVDQEWLYGMSLLSEVAALGGDAKSASILHRLLAPWAELNASDPGEGIRGSVSRYLGLLATTLGRSEQAATHFDQALAANARMRAMPWLAHTRRDYAKLLAARDGGDRGRALQLISDALTIYQELGMDGSAAEATAVQRKLRTG
jgi:DNA-binding SARP family transcriptional activator